MIESYTIAGVSGVSVNLGDPSSYPVLQHNISRDMRFSESAKPRQHGIWPDYTWTGKMSIETQLDIVGTDTTDYMNKRLALQAALVPLPELGYTYVCELIFLYTGMSEQVVVFADLDGDATIPMDGGYPSVGHCQILFRCPFPYFTGATVFSQQTGTPSGAGGRSYPKSYPFSYGAGATGGEITVTPQGNVPSPPTIRIDGPCTNPTISLVVGGSPQTFAFNSLILAAGEYVTIDMYARTVINNNGFNVKGGVAPGSVWWALLPNAANDVLYRAFDFSSPSQATISYRNLYKL